MRDKHLPAERAWRPGFWRRAPVTALAAMIVAILCAVAAIVVLKATHGMPIDHWRTQQYSIQPTVVLSILATTANVLFRYAFFEGATIAWWVRAKQGTTLDSLYRNWNSTQSVFPLFSARKGAVTTALASFCVLLLLLDGPLLQRASSVNFVKQQKLVSLTIPVSPDPFLPGITGVYGGTDDDPYVRYYTPLYLEILQQYSKRTPITLPAISSCKGQCEFDIVAAGWDVKCQNWTSRYQLPTFDQHAAAVLDQRNHSNTYKGPDINQIMFWSNVTFEGFAQSMWMELGHDVHELYPFSWDSIFLSSMVKSTPGINGTLSWRYCGLQEGVQRYPVTLTNSTLTMLPTPSTENFTVYIFSRYDEDNSIGLTPSTLGGFAHSIELQFSGNATVGLDIYNRTEYETTGSSPLMYVSSGAVPNVEDNSFLYEVTWKDPIDDMINMLRELSLRMVIATSLRGPIWNLSSSPVFDIATNGHSSGILYPNLTAVNWARFQNVSATMKYDETIYESHFSWLSGALIVIALAFFSILSTFRGWWHLGRSVGMSPLEIANAFDAPLLRQADPNAEGKELVAQIGDRRVQYGALSARKSTGHLLTPDHSPQMSSSLLHKDGSSDVDRDEVIGSPRSKRRLHIGREGIVEEPYEGGEVWDAQKIEYLRKCLFLKKRCYFKQSTREYAIEML